MLDDLELWDEPEAKPEPERRWKFRASCCVCGKLIEEGRETPRGLIPVGFPYPKPDHTIGLQCRPCRDAHEAHKAE